MTAVDRAAAEGADGAARQRSSMEAVRARLAPVTPWLFVALAAAYLANRDLGTPRALVVVPAIALAFVAALALKLEDVVYGQHRGAGVALFVAGALPTLAIGAQSGRVDRTMALVPMLVGWGLFCALPVWPHATRRSAEVSPRAARWLVPLVVVAGGLGALGFMALNTGDGVIVVDETLYLLQAAVMGEPGFARHIDPALARFFAVQQAVTTPDGRIYTQFPPGWPALLALFDAVGLRWWTGVACGAASVLFTYLLGRRLCGRYVGLLAAALLATQALFLTMAGSYMAHAAGAACAVAAAWLLLVGEAADGGRRLAAWLGAGVLLGVGVTIRPLTGGSLALSLGLWMLLRRRLTVGGVAALATSLAAGAALPLAWMLYYNAATTGSPFTFGYNAVHGSLHDMGFGRRGMVLLDEHGRPRDIGRPFTPRSAMQQLAGRAEGVASQLLPAFLTFPVLLAGVIYRYRYRWATVAAFSILPAAYFFYWFSDWRFYLELYPFALVGLAAVLYYVRQRDRTLSDALATFALAASLVTTGTYLYKRATQAERLHAYFRAVRGAQQRYGKVLVFARSSLANDVPFTWLYALNARPFPGPVVVARDLGAENAELVARFPGYVPVRVRPFVPGRPLVVPLDSSRPAAGPGRRPRSE